MNYKELHEFRKAFNKSIMFRGKLFELLKELWKVTPKVAGGVRWYLEWEQIAQMDEMGITCLAKDIVPKAKPLKLNKASVAKTKKWPQDHLLPRLIVQCGAVSENDRTFCSTT